MFFNKSYYKRIKQALLLIDKSERVSFILLMVCNSLISLIEASAIALLYSFFSIAMGTDSYLLNKLIYFGLAPVNNTQNEAMIILSVLIILIFFIRTAFVLSVRWYYLSFIKKLTERLSVNLFSSYVDAKFSVHLSKKTSFIINNIWGNSKPVVVNCTAGFIEIFSSLVMIFAVSVVMIINQPIATVVILLFVLCLSISYLLFIKRRIHLWGERAVKLTEGIYDIISQAMIGIQSVKLFNLEDSTKKDFRTLVTDQTSIVRLNGFVAEIPRYIIEVILITIIMLIMIFSFYKGGDVKDIIPSLVLFGTSTFRIIPSVSKLITHLQAFKFTIPALDRILSDYDYTKGKVLLPNLEVRPQHDEESFGQSISVEGVGFNYADSGQVIKDINLTINKGDFIGFAGRSGSGKTTTLNILLGLLEPTAGQVKIDGASVSYPEGSARLRRLFSFVPQKPFIINGSFERNICLIEDDERAVNDALYDEVLVNSCLTEVASRLPNGRKTYIGDGLGGLSGGEAQRVCFARALYSQKNLIALDEPTSSLDVETETQIIANLLNNKIDKTVIMIAHRLHTLKKCDVIYFFDQGKIIASGSFSELKEKCDLFRNMIYEIEAG